MLKPKSKKFRFGARIVEIQRKGEIQEILRK